MLVTRALSQSLGEEPPTEFLLFKAGVNETSKGPALFDAQAAEMVMATYRREGHDLMIDLEHYATDRDAKLLKSDATDAMAWFSLEVRNGELWAANVRWTPEGERRLRARSQRFTSPAFHGDTKTRRVVDLVNVALCSMPATFSALPLVAASSALPNNSGSALETLSKILQARISRSSLTK